MSYDLGLPREDKTKLIFLDSWFYEARGVFRGGFGGSAPPPGKVKALIFRGVSAPNGG